MLKQQQFGVKIGKAFALQVQAKDYYGIGDKETEGTPYEAFIEYSNPRKLYLWPKPSTTYTIKFLKVTKISSLDSASSTVDYEKGYYGALISKTAAILAVRLNRPDRIISRAELLADKKINMARAKDIRSENKNTMHGAYQY